MNGDAHEVAEFAIERVELVADDFSLPFNYHEVGMGCHNILEGEGVIAPEILEARLLDAQERGDVAQCDRAHPYLLVARRGDVEINFVVGVEQAVELEVARKQDGAQPVVIQVVAGVMEIASAALYQVR